MAYITHDNKLFFQDNCLQVSHTPIFGRAVTKPYYKKQTYLHIALPPHPSNIIPLTPSHQHILALLLLTRRRFDLRSLATTARRDTLLLMLPAMLSVPLMTLISRVTRVDGVQSLALDRRGEDVAGAAQYAALACAGSMICAPKVAVA